MYKDYLSLSKTIKFNCPKEREKWQKWENIAQQEKQITDYNIVRYKVVNKRKYKLVGFPAPYDI